VPKIARFGTQNEFLKHVMCVVEFSVKYAIITDVTSFTTFIK